MLGVVLAAVVAAMVWQHLHYLDARRNALHDLQDVFHSNEALHAVTFLELAPCAERPTRSPGRRRSMPARWP